MIHALQWLPMLAWAGRRLGLDEALRLRLMASATGGTFLLAVYALLQTLAGRPRVDGSLPLAVMLAAAVVLMVGPAVLMPLFRRSPPHSPTAV